MHYRFRRCTHDLAGNFREEFRDVKPIPPGDIDPMHWITPNADGDSFDDIVAHMQGDQTNFMDLTGPCGATDDRSAYPHRHDIAIGLVRLLECGIAEVVPASNG